MPAMEFKLKREFIELDNLLKVMEFASGSSAARQKIRDGLVRVNGEVESRLRRKLRSGDCVELSGKRIDIVS